MRAYRVFKQWAWLIASFYATCHLVCQAIIAGQELSPAAIALDHFDRDYHGQHWLSITGHVDLDRAVVRPAPRGNRCEVWAPMSSTNGDGSEAVHVYALLGPFDRNELDSSLVAYRSPEITLTGSQVFFDPDRVLPSVQHGDPIIMVQEGNKPLSANESWAGASVFGSIFVLSFWLVVIRPLNRAVSPAPVPQGLVGAAIK